MKSTRNLPVLFGCTVTLFSVIFFLLSYSEKQTTSAQEAEQNDAPIARYLSNEELRTANAQLSPERTAKNRRYDKSFTVEELPPGLLLTPRSGDWILRVPALPVSQSDAVIIGHVTSAEAFLSNDQTGIYSEFTILVDEMLKNNAIKAFKSGDPVVAERAGGAVQFPSGRIQRVHVYSGQRMPQIGNKYMLFLKRTETDANPTILTGYELREGRIIPLDNIRPYSDYAGMNEQRFLDAVRAEIISFRDKQEGGGSK